MIIQVVQETDNCMGCLNFKRIVKRKNNPTELYGCKALPGILIGGSEGVASILYLRNKVSNLCPFGENDVNKQQ